jgi:hypothetical protein
MDRTVGPDWQAWTKVAVTLAVLRSHPIEQVLAPNTIYHQDWIVGAYDTATNTVLRFDTELNQTEINALTTLFNSPTTVCAAGMAGWGSGSGFTRLRIQDIYNNMAAFIVTGAGLPSNSCTVWVDRSSPSIPNEEWDLLYLDFDRDLTLQQRKNVEAAFSNLIAWILA